LRHVRGYAAPGATDDAEPRSSGSDSTNGVNRGAGDSVSLAISTHDFLGDCSVDFFPAGLTCCRTASTTAGCQQSAGPHRANY
jgi:hypothetical protein